jgi:isoleucyl-tRNA synthetase
MRAGLPQREPEWLARWERLGVYDRLRANATGRRPFILHDGPPYANGHLHIGHALNKVLKDMVVRSQQMMGRDARYVPGWDCHGLPIEWKIEEKYRAAGLDKDAVDIVDFRQECRRFAEGWIDIQRDEFKRLGITGKWDKPYLTMDYHAEAVIADEFMKLVMNGSLYQGSKPVMWSPVEKTALAEAEVEYHEHTSHTVWVKFPLAKVGANEFADGVKHLLLDPALGEVAAHEVVEELLSASVVIWTTTPWTIPQNRAVCFGHAISYGLYKIVEVSEGSKEEVGAMVILAEALAETAFAQAKVKADLRRTVSARELAALTLAHPFRGLAENGEWDFDVPMLPGDHVTDDAGTGFVHTAPGHGADDFEVWKAHGHHEVPDTVEPPEA